jgi:hypothetical protein
MNLSQASGESNGLMTAMGGDVASPVVVFGVVVEGTVVPGTKPLS